MAADELADFLSEVIKNDLHDFCNFKQNYNPAQFWSHYLDGKKLAVMGPTLKKLVEISLSLPAGSAEAERGFSIMNHVKYDRRSRLTPKHLEDLMRIRINGPPLSDFDAPRYALEWLKEHKHTDDPTGTRKKDESMDTDRQAKSILF